MKPSERVITFIDTSVNAAKPRRGKRTEYRVQDTRRQIMAGLVLDVLPGGKKVWRCHYDLRRGEKRVRRKVKLGTHSTSLQTVKKLWQEVRDAADEGRDYVTEQKEKARKEAIEAARSVTLADFVDTYIEKHAKPNKRSWQGDDYRLRKYVLPEIGHMQLGEVQKRDVRRLTEAIAKTAPTQADRVRQAISSVYAYAIATRDEDGETLVNPAKGIGAYQTQEKERKPVPPSAIAALWPIFDADGLTSDRWRANAIARIALLTGLRISEIIGAQRDELGELEARKPIWKLKAERTGRKRKKPHSVPLTPALQFLFREALARSDHLTQVFYATEDEGEAYRKTWYHVVECAYADAGVPSGIGLHSMRHFATTQMAYAGVGREWRDRVTDHSGPYSRGEDKRYNHYDFYAEKLQALLKLDGRVRQLITGERESGNVVMLETAVR
jgi:integrase